MEEEKIPTPKRTFYSIFMKRFLDILLSFFAILLLLPVLLIVCVLELIIHGRPIIYSTKRPGKNGVVFNMYKFRSMTNEKGEDGYLLPEEKRLTKFGHFLRKTSIDELPGLFNILKGDMSIIGPRPLLIEYMDLYSKRHSMRQSVRPGLTLERIRKTDSNTWTWRDQFENDIWYIEHISFITDLRMVFAIIKAVFKGSETRASDTRVPFNGNNLDETRTKQEVGFQSKFESINQDKKQEDN